MPLEPEFGELLADHVGGGGLARLVRYCELLERWSRVHNLVRYRDRRELVEQHLLDALAARDMVGSGGLLLDVGSGAGLPGVPLLAVLPGWRGVLLEPRQKRWAFLRLVVRELGLDAEVVAARYQAYPAAGTAFDAILARAVGGYPELAGWARDRLAAEGRLLVWTGAAEERRLRTLSGWRVLSSPLPHQARGRLLQLIPCFT